MATSCALQRLARTPGAVKVPPMATTETWEKKGIRRMAEVSSEEVLVVCIIRYH